MANRFTVDRYWSFLKGLSLVRAHILMSGTTPILQAWQYPQINSGSAGSYATAGTTSSPQGGIGTASIGTEGVKSVTRTDVGLWTVVLHDNYNRVLEIGVQQTLAGGLSTIVAVGNNSTITSMTSAGGSTIGIALLNATATAADPATTTYVTLNFVLQNSTAP